MGVFLNVLLLKNTTEEKLKAELEKEKDSWDVVPEECQYQQGENGIQVLLNDHCSGYEVMTQALSEALDCPVMLCYIYDDDFWGYDFYDKGKEVDTFCPMPDYFEEADEEERERVAGNAEKVAPYFDIEPKEIANYLQFWTEEMWDGDEEVLAYDEDECTMGDSWQMVDFMEKLGFSYDWE